MSTSSSHPSTAIQIVPVAGRIGAELRGVKLTPDLDPASVATIRAALLKHKVLFFRGQQHLDDPTQERLTGIFNGRPVSHPTVPVAEGTSHILELDSRRGGRANSWHTDVTFVPAYPKITILRGLIIPQAGGDTVWANTATAYDGLPAQLKALADSLWAVHTNEYDYAARQVTSHLSLDDLKKYQEVFTSTVYETEHPVVHVHPETGERNLLLGHFVKRFLGLSSTDSHKLLELFQSHIISQENTVRWRWSEGDVVVWDNRATQHYAVNDYGDQVRVVHRVTIDGEVPVAIDGRRSVNRVQQPKAQVATGKAA